jgi:hypothetical protein
MKKPLLFALLAAAFISCNETKPPKEVAKEFITALYAGDGTAAAALATEKTKMNVAVSKTDVAGVSADESFSLSSLSETISGNTAEVKNELVKITLEKEGNDWKAVASPELVSGVADRQKNLAELKSRWDALQKEYEARLQLAKDYISYKKSLGLSPQMKTLEEMVNTLSVKTVWDKEKILLYVQKQKQLDDLIDKALEPSYSANSDLSMNYFLQLNNASDRIKYAEGSYQELAEKTSSPVYPPLPFKASNSTKVN